MLEDLLNIKHVEVRWSNFLIKSAIDCSLVEKRALYFISLWVKNNFTEKKLGVPENWKDLYMHLTNKDLGVIGGKKNIPRTYKALKLLGQKFIPVSYTNERGERIHGRIHWIDSFFYNCETGLYDVRISPDIMKYMINVKSNFTDLDVGEAMTFRSKQTQTLYEYISMYRKGFRYSNKESKSKGFNYASNVVPITVEQLRELCSLTELRDVRTGEIERKPKYASYYPLQKNILKKAQDELYMHYKLGTGCIWFDFQPATERKRGRTVKTVYLYIYTKDNPKKGVNRPWQEGDELLSPYVTNFEEAAKLTPKQRLHANPLYHIDSDAKEAFLARKLSRYFDAEEVAYYMGKTRQEMQMRKYNKTDVIMQMIQVIQDKEKQPKFKRQTLTYQRNCLELYVFTNNLQKDFGWSIPPQEGNNHWMKKKNLQRSRPSQYLFPRY